MKTTEQKDNIFLKFIYEWGVFLISILIIVAYLIFSASPSDNGLWTNILFSTLNLLASFYVAQKVALWGWKTETAQNQKKIAKSAIRQNRTTLTSIVKLLKITREKIDAVEDPLTNQYLKEIRNHLEMIYNASKNSEANFNDIVNEELAEQNILEVEISEIFDQIEQKNQELKDVQGEHEADKKVIQKLKKDIRDKENELSTKLSSLPFGTGSTIIDSNHYSYKLHDSVIGSFAIGSSPLPPLAPPPPPSSETIIGIKPEKN